MALSATLSSRGQSPSILLQPPRKWTAEHLKIAKVVVSEAVPSNDIVPDYIPGDDDEGNSFYLQQLWFLDSRQGWYFSPFQLAFVALASLFCDASRGELEGYAPLKPSSSPEQNMFGDAFKEITRLFETVQLPYSRYPIYLNNDCLMKILRTIIIHAQRTNGKL